MDAVDVIVTVDAVVTGDAIDAIDTMVTMDAVDVLHSTSYFIWQVCKFKQFRGKVKEIVE